MKVNDTLLKEFMTSFYGYGNLEGNYWFIGMEEGGEATPTEIISRTEAWEKLGKETLLDNYEFHTEINRGYHFVKDAKYQRTWGGLIKILHSIKSEETPTLQKVKRYQSEQLGRSNSENCLLEVFPLPSPNTNDFPYKDMTSIEYLKTRELYKEYLADKRIKKLNGLIFKHKPKFVLFYSSSSEYIKYWSKISGVNFEQVDKDVIVKSGRKDLKAQFKFKNGTCFAVTHHPTYSGVSGEYLHKIGQRMRQIYIG